MTTYQKLQQEKDSSLSYLRYDSTPYKETELEKIYDKAYFDGIDGCPGRSFSLEELTGDKRKAYVHGFFTGDDEAQNADD